MNLPLQWSNWSRDLLPAFKTWRRFTPFLYGERWKITLALLAMVGATAATLASPLPIALVFDGVLFGKRAAGLAGSIKEFDLQYGTAAALALLSVAYLLIIGVDAILDYSREILSASIAQRVVYRVRRATFANLLRQPVDFFRKQRGGDLLLRLTGDVGMIRDMLVPSVIEAMQQMLVLLGMLCVVFLISWKLGLVAFAVIPLLGLTFVRGARMLTDVSREHRKREGKLAAWAAASFQAIPVVQVFGRERDAEEQFGASNRKSMKASLRATRLEVKVGRTVDFLTGVGTCAVLVVGAYEVRALELTAGELLIVMSYLRQVYKPLRTFGKLSARTAKAAACGERVLEILEKKSTIVDAPDAASVDRFRGGIVFKNVTVDYGVGAKSLDSVSLKLNPGERVALIGPSGAGKSTLLSLIARLLDPTEGEVLIDGVNIRMIRLADLRRNIAISFQEPGLLGETIRENIAFGLHDADAGAIQLAASRAGVDQIARSKTLGLDAPVAEHGASLSGGEKQRIALARMVLRNAPIVLLDEPFSALDPHRQAALEDALFPLLEGRTSIFITHRLDRMHVFDRVVLMQDGKIVADGSPRELQRSCPEYRALIAIHARSPMDGGLAREHVEPDLEEIQP